MVSFGYPFRVLRQILWVGKNSIFSIDSLHLWNVQYTKYLALHIPKDNGSQRSSDRPSSDAAI